MIVALILFGGIAFLVRYKFLGRRISWIWAVPSAIIVWVVSVVFMWWSSFSAGTVSAGILGRSIWYGLFTAIIVYFVLRKKPSQKESTPSEPKSGND